MSTTTTPTQARAYSFTDHSTRQPGTPQPGDRLDREFDAIYQALQALGSLTRAVQTTAKVAFDDLAPSTILRLKQELAPSIADATRQIALLTDVLNTRVDDTLAAQQAVQDRLEQMADSAARAEVARDQASWASEAAAAAVQTSADDATDAANSANDAALSAASAFNDEELAGAWAEYMPTEIPARFFAHTSITGQHWSSRWWANQAAAAFGSLASLYLGAHPAPPATTATGEPIPTGAIYYNTTSEQAFVWNGSEWVPFYAPTKALMLTLSYAATAEQTTFPLSTPDRNGQTYTVNPTVPEPLDVYVNGSRLPRDAPVDGTGDWDFDPATNTLTFLKPLLAGSLVLIDILSPASAIAPSRVQTQPLEDIIADGTTVTFPLYLVGHVPLTVGSAVELFIALDGVPQQPGRDYNTTSTTVTFGEAPGAGARVWGLWYGPGGDGVLPPTGGTVTGPLLYTATGGTVARSAQDRAGQVIDIRDLGAACDGVTDDTAVWTVAFAKPNGTVIRIPQNCVSIVSDGHFLANAGRAISIIGDGKGSVIRLKAGTALVNDLFSWSGGARNVRVENLTIDFNNCPQPASLRQIVNLVQVNGASVRNVSIINGVANLYMIAIMSSTDFIVENCYCQLTTGSSTAQSKGIVTLGALGPCTRGRIANNICINTNTNFAAASQMYIAGNDVSGWGVGAGIATDPNASLNTIIGNTLHDSLTVPDMFSIIPNGIENWSSNTVIASNKSFNCGAAGIATGGASCHVVGNVCWDNNTGGGGANAGIMVTTGAPATASGSAFIANYCFDSGVNRQGYGFRVNNSGITNLTLNANRFSGYQGDVQLSNATFTTNTDYVPRTLAADPTVPLGAATKQYVDGRGVGNRLLYQTSTLVGNGADLTQDVLQTYTVPANTLLNVGDRLIIRAGGSYVGSTDSKVVALRWGGANLGTLTISTVSNQAWKIEAEIMKTATNAQVASLMFVTNFNATSTVTTPAARTDSVSNAIDITGQNSTTATASTITCRYFTVDYVAAA